MKKVVSILLTASMIACSAALPLTAIAAETTSVTTTTMPAVDDPIVQTAVVTVTIMDISGDNVLVKPVDGSPELKSSSKFSLSAKQLPADINPKVGMKLEITYNGGILETYPAMFGNVHKVVEVKDDTVKEDPTLLKGTKDMTLNDVMRLAELGDELDWADFKDYKGRDVGSGLYIWEFTLEDDYVLDVGGTTDKKPLYILLSHDDDKGIDIRTDDVEKYLSDSAQVSNIKGDANCDGQVDLSDAVMIMQALANPNKYGICGTAEHHLTEQGKLNSDMDGNGLTVGDALAIQRKLLGLDYGENDSDIVVFEMSPSDAGVAEFLANNPTIKSSYKDDELFNITPQEITDKYGFKIFKYSGNCETYLEYKGKTYQLGSGWGGLGTVSFAVADLNNDGYYELYFTYSWGSGLNHAVLDCIDITSSIKFEGFEQLDYSMTDGFALAVENGKLGVYKAKYTSSGFVDIKAEPTVKLGEIIADNEKNKVFFVPVSNSDIDIDKSAIAGKIFAYEKEGAGGYCTLSFSENGRFLYYPGKLSSYMDGGDWKVDGDTVSLIGMENKTIYLKITDDTLVYIAEGSDEFPYMDIKDGEKFNIYRPEISADKFQLNSRYSEYGLSDPKVELDLIVSELPEFCYVENVRLYDEDDNFIGTMSPAMDADIWSYLVDCHVTEECSKTFYTLTKVRCGEKTYLDDVRSEITVNFKDTPAP